jgi:beta-glucanase (GH16 family)
MMKTILYRISLSVSILTVLFACKTNEASNQTSTDEIKYPASNLHDDSYHPGEGWNLVWADEFIDPVVSDDWTRQEYPDGNWNKEWQKYTASDENTYIDSGCLVIKAIHTSTVHDTFNYTSARLHTGHSHSWKYGKFVARIQLPYGNGTWPAFWMMGDNITEVGGDTDWPFCGEIDILETYGSKNDSVLECNIHFWNETFGESGSHDQMHAKKTKLKDGIFADAFHVFEIEWDSTVVIWRLNSEEYARFSLEEDYLTEFSSEKFYILLNLAIGGLHSGIPDGTTVFPQYMYIDWVRVYQNDNVQ